MSADNLLLVPLGGEAARILVPILAKGGFNVAVANDVDGLRQTRLEIRPAAAILLVSQLGTVEWEPILAALQGVRTLVYGELSGADFRVLSSADRVEFIPPDAGSAGVLGRLGGPRPGKRRLT